MICSISIQFYLKKFFIDIHISVAFLSSSKYEKTDLTRLSIDIG